MNRRVVVWSLFVAEAAALVLVTVGYIASAIGFWPFFAVLMAMICCIPVTACGLVRSEGWVQMEDDGIHLKAPMVDLVIPFGSITAVSLVPRFKPGLRTFGYGGLHTGSGEFSNEMLGSYTYAGDERAENTIVVRYAKGKARHAAFNLPDAEETKRIYEAIVERTGAGQLECTLSPEQRESIRASHRSVRRTLIAAVAIITIVTVAILAWSFTTGNVSVQVDEECIKVDAPLVHKTVMYDEIIDVQLRDDVDFGERKAGVSNLSVHSGTFKNPEFGRYKLAVCNGTEVCIVVSTTDSVLVFGLEDRRATTEIYDAILDRISTERPSPSAKLDTSWALMPA